VNLDRQATLLRKTLSDIAKWDFQRFQGLDAGPWTAELHEPADDGTDELIQLEAELLQVFEDGSIQVTVLVYGPERTLGADVVATDNGRAEWSGETFELIAGVPTTLHT
jgi:hypothetical protein